MLRERSYYKEGLPVNVVVANIKAYPIHFHEDIEVVYVLEGSVILKNGYYTYTLKQGDIFILNDNEIHSFDHTGEDNMVMMLQMDLSYFANYYDDFHNCFFVTDVEDENDESLDVLRSILARVMMEILQKGHGYEHRVIENTHNLISCLVSDFQYFAMEDGRFVNEVKNKGNKVLAGRLHRITDYMYENYARKLTLGEIAEREHLSIYYLSHVIKEATGLSFQDLLNFIRVEESEKLLLGSSKKVGVIAEECGFSAVRYYIKHFETWFAMSPSEYRNKYTGKVSSREIAARYDKCAPGDIEGAIRRQEIGVYNAYISEGTPKPIIVTLDIAESMMEKRLKPVFPEQIFERDLMKAAARPFILFKNLNEPLLLSDPQCMISTPAHNPAKVNHLSILIYNFGSGFLQKMMTLNGKEQFLETLRAFDDGAEILVRCSGISGSFRVSRYKMSRENVISTCEDLSRLSGPLNKRQALLNSWSTLPDIEQDEISVSETLNLRFVMRGLSAELILIDRK